MTNYKNVSKERLQELLISLESLYMTITCDMTLTKPAFERDIERVRKAIDLIR